MHDGRAFLCADNGSVTSNAMGTASPAEEHNERLENTFIRLGGSQTCQESPQPNLCSNGGYWRHCSTSQIWCQSPAFSAGGGFEKLQRKWAPTSGGMQSKSNEKGNDSIWSCQCCPQPVLTVLSINSLVSCCCCWALIKMSWILATSLVRNSTSALLQIGFCWRMWNWEYIEEHCLSCNFHTEISAFRRQWCCIGKL